MACCQGLLLIPRESPCEEGRNRMFKSIDPKSMLIGGLLVLLAVACFAGVPWLQEDTFGRFAMGTTDEGAFILDTSTGQTWAYIVPEGFVASVPGTDEFFAPKLDMEFDAPESRFDGLEAFWMPVAPESVHFDLEFFLRRQADGLRGTCDYSTDLLDSTTIERWIGHYVTLLEEVGAAMRRQERSL